MKEPLIQLNGWQTITAYAKERNATTQYVSKLVRQGKLHFRIYPELNDLKLVKERDSDRRRHAVSRIARVL